MGTPISTLAYKSTCNHNNRYDLCEKMHCTACSKEFGMFLKKHHCRTCHWAYCDKCAPVRDFGIRKCNGCIKDETHWKNELNIRLMKIYDGLGFGEKRIH